MKPQPSRQKPGSFFDTREQLEKAENLRLSGKLVQAQKICENLLKQYPGYVAALQTLGLVLADRGQLKQARNILTEALSHNPRSTALLTAISTVYVELEAFEMARLSLQQVLQQKPGDSGAMIVLGEVFLAEKEYERAAGILQEAIDLESDTTIGRLSLANALVYMGRYEDAARILNEFARSNEPATSVLYRLSQLPPRFIDVDILSLLQTAKKSANMDQQNFDALFAFTKSAALHTAGRPEESWEMLKSVNREKFRQMREDYKEGIPRRQDFLARAAQSAELKKGINIHENHPVSLFIFGPSRSGKTSLERLIGTLEGIKLGYENPILSNVARRTFQLAGLPTRHSIVGIPPALDGLCREQYLVELHQRTGDARVFTNTHPGGIYDAYRLAVLIPNARFIFMKRNLEDITYRIFGKFYRSGNNYSYNLEAAKEYINWYYDSIDAMAKLLPNCSTIIQYEDMIAEPQSAIASAAQLCGIEMSHSELPEIGDDRGCAKPYLEFI